MYLHTFNRAN